VSGEDPANIAEVAGSVRIAIEPPGADVITDQPLRQQDRVVFEADHLGALAGTDLTSLEGSLRNYRLTREKKLNAFQPKASSSKELLEQAQLMFAAELAKSADAAVKAGSYVVTPSNVSLPLAIPGGELLQTSAVRDEAAVKVTIIMPHANFPALRNAREYLDDMRFFDDSEKARSFNALDRAARDALVAEVDAFRKGGRTPNQDELRRVRQVLGLRYDLDRQNVILHAVPARK